MHWIQVRVVKPSAIATGFVALALLLTFPLQHVIAYPFVFLFFGAVMCSAWFAGLVGGMIAVALSSLAITYFFVPPQFSMTVAKEGQNFLIAVILCALAVAFVSSNRKNREMAVRHARDELEQRVKMRTAELERSNQELQESERQLRLLTEAIPQQIWRANGDGNIEYCNHDLVEYVGVPLENLLGQPVSSLVHPDDASLFEEAWQANRELGTKFEMQVRVRGADQALRWFLIRGLPQRTTDGNIARWYGVHIDIEDQYRAKQELLMTQDDISRLSRTYSMAEMAASIAHELNQPLTAVVTHAYACRQWLGAEPANLEKASATAEKIVRESTRASEVVRRVRSLFSQSAQLRESSDINRLILDLMPLLREEGYRRAVSVSVHLAEGLPPLEVDPVQIQQVVLNLAMNGMDAMMEVSGPRSLEISTEYSQTGDIDIAVRDYGTGVSDTAKQKMFEPFFTTKAGGTGMGLAICQSIVKAHSGKIWAADGQPGTEFHVALKLQKKTDIGSHDAS